MFERLREMANEPISNRGVDLLVSCALAIWTFGQIVFVHSTIGTLPFVVSNGIAQFHQALVAGCLVAALASRHLNLKPSGIVALFGGLFATVAVWRKASQPHLIVLLLFAIAAQGMDFRRLVRWYVASALAGILVACGSAVVGLMPTNVLLDATDFEVGYGFATKGVLACLLFSVLVGLALGSRDESAWRRTAIACALYVPVALVVLGSTHVAVLTVAFAACAYAGACRRDVVDLVASRQAWRWAVAVFPLVAFCMTLDAPKYFGFPALKGGYSTLVGTYGYGALLCVGVLYVRAVLLVRRAPWSFLALCACVLFSLLLAYNKAGLYLECNCTLLLLAQGTGSSRHLMVRLAQPTGREVL